jgi:predicted enzyme related to lactoylglutathione lyase
MPDQPAFKHGDICWNELMTPDANAASKFYSTLFGWNVVATPMGPFTYHVLKRDGKDFGGMMAMQGPGWENVPPHWMMYIAVDDVDATCRKLTDLGGKVCVPPTDIPPGRFAVVSDPSGATFSVFKGKAM